MRCPRSGNAGVPVLLSPLSNAKAPAEAGALILTLKTGLLQRTNRALERIVHERNDRVVVEENVDEVLELVIVHAIDRVGTVS